MARQKLTRDAIVAEAMALLSEQGLDGLSMRNLAARLDVQAPTLYYHIPDKSALLNEIMNTLFDLSFERVGDCQTWQEWMVSFGEAMWDVHEEYPFTPLLLMTAARGPDHAARNSARLQAVLSRFDADPKALYLTQSAIQAVVTGWSVLSHTYPDWTVVGLPTYRESMTLSVARLVEGWSGLVAAKSHELEA
jgi:TetR/AcrR family tetracycline transcriptional repressor